MSRFNYQISNLMQETTLPVLLINWFKIKWLPLEYQISNVKFQMSNFKCQISNFKCQISNVKFQTSNFKCHFSNTKCQSHSGSGDNPSCANHQLTQNQVTTFRISNFKRQISNVKFQISNFKCQFSNLKCQISNVKFQTSNFKCHFSNTKFQSHSGSGDNPSCAIHQLIQYQVTMIHISNLKCQITYVKYWMSLFKCQTLNVTFQISNFKYHAGGNPSCATHYLIQHQVTTFNISNLECQISNVKFQLPNIKCHFLNIKFEISCRRQPFACYSTND